MEDRIALVGMMGCGKSKIGKRISEVIDFEFVDLDSEFEKIHGSIKSYFEKYGENNFRKVESTLLENISKKRNFVLSTGAGIVENDKNREILKTMRTFYLEADSGILWERVKNSSRPLVQKGKENFLKRFESRKQFYEMYEKVEEESLNSDQVAAKIVKLILKEEIFEFSSYQHVRIAHNAEMERYDLSVVSKNVRKIWKIDGLELEDGESLKSIENVQKLWNTFLKMGLSRNSRIVAIGGGTLTDALGFVSTTYMRGMKLTLFPTTLLGMVDASIGGKFAINFNGVKNLIGTFGKPDVFVDPIYTLTLEDERFKEGIVESIKIATVYDEQLFEYMEKNLQKIIIRNIHTIDELVKIAIKDKLEVISKDPKDENLRHILNFGHTIGHAIESQSGNSISHGRAVAIGMMAESEKFSPKIYERLKNFMTSLGFEYDNIEDLQKWIQSDKKRIGNAILIPIIDKIGHSKLEKIGSEFF